MFAPWILYKNDFQSIGGHDPLFAPFPYEDSDIFQRWILAGYELVQSRDAFVYHLTCRGHRWTEQVGKDDEYFKQASNRAAKNYLRKWGSWIKNDEYQYPIILPKYNIGFKANKCSIEMLSALEPWCSTISSDASYAQWLENEQNNTTLDLRNRVKPWNSGLDNDIIVEFDASKLTQQSFGIIQQLPMILQESGEIGEFELDIFKIKIKSLKTYEKDLIFIRN